ncbi:MAG: hypothetical protein V4487_00730 [Chlamydiota bacterium]
MSFIISQQDVLSRHQGVLNRQRWNNPELIQINRWNSNKTVLTVIPAATQKKVIQCSQQSLYSPVNRRSNQKFEKHVVVYTEQATPSRFQGPKMNTYINGYKKN